MKTFESSTVFIKATQIKRNESDSQSLTNIIEVVNKLMFRIATSFNCFWTGKFNTEAQNSSRKALIGWKKASPLKKSLCNSNVKRQIVQNKIIKKLPRLCFHFITICEKIIPHIFPLIWAAIFNFCIKPATIKKISVY